MPELRDTSALAEWLEREDPVVSVWLLVRKWVDGLAEISEQAPSVYVEEMSHPGERHVRVAVIPVTNGEVEFWYSVTFPSEAIDLILVVGKGS